MASPVQPVEVNLHRAPEVRLAIGRELAVVEELLAVPLTRIRQGESTVVGPKHPLTEVLDATRKWIEAPDMATRRVEGYSIEALGLGPLLRARDGDPALPELIASMVVPEQYLHALGLLGVAYAIQAAGWARDVRLLRKVGQEKGRVADLGVTIAPGIGFQVEAKAPRALRELAGDLRATVARAVVRHAINDACNPDRPQLRNNMPGTVALLSRGLSTEEGLLIEKAAIGHLGRVGSRYPYLMGVLVVNLQRTMTPIDTVETSLPDGRRRVSGNVRVAFGSRRWFAPNPRYVGTVRLDVEEGHQEATETLDLSTKPSAPGGANP